MTDSCLWFVPDGDVVAGLSNKGVAWILTYVRMHTRTYGLYVYKSEVSQAKQKPFLILLIPFFFLLSLKKYLCD